MRVVENDLNALHDKLYVCPQVKKENLKYNKLYSHIINNIAIYTTNQFYIEAYNIICDLLHLIL